MIGRISRRDDFTRLHREGTVATAGPVRVRALRQPGAGVRVAFAARRQLGTAVQRNRLRRRARAVMAELARQGRLDEGWYLVMFRDGSVDLTYTELRDLLSRCLGAAR